MPSYTTNSFAWLSIIKTKKGVLRMSIAAKQNLVKELEKKLENTLTITQLAAVKESLVEALSKYDVESTRQDVADADSIDLLEAFLSAKVIEGRSEKTVAYYRYIIQRMQKDIGVPLREITVFHLRQYLMRKKESGSSDKTLESLRSVFCSYFGWLFKERLLPENPCVNLAPIKCAKKIRTPYSEIDVERLKENCKNSRDKAMISFLLSTGCRISEVCSLNRDSIDFRTKECTVLGKGNKERTVFLDDVTAMLVERYISERTDTSEALFAGKGTDRMTPSGVRARLHRIADKADVNNVHPHRFRRTLATRLIDHGMHIQEVAAILGHDKLDTTMKYVYIDKTNVKNAYRKYA